MLASDATVIKLYGGIATADGKRLFISKLDASLSTLVNCECVSRSGCWCPPRCRLFPLLALFRIL